ncbi:hypothetical protein BN1051_02860 [Arthrobacter saudimassiliensis]|uniref:Uncharacterized protein n=1 Tax=Arthrobacter saudimassiliensis TaxID=1461584 RepID=A0A078MT47_9MICC|nr:hypothetical protein BN1051_02860 [Arthrobacter saudimassiliensis]
MNPPYPVGYSPRLLSAAAYVAAASEERCPSAPQLEPEDERVLRSELISIIRSLAPGPLPAAGDQDAAG